VRFASWKGLHSGYWRTKRVNPSSSKQCACVRPVNNSAGLWSARSACSLGRKLTFWELGPQQVIVDFAGGCVATDAGLLPLRLLDKQLGVLSTIAQRLPDPRTQKLVTHTRQALLTQEVYQILTGYPDGNDAQQLRMHGP
jgi:hypothetical protein